jgi:uncharacterized membrane protein
VTNLLPVTLFVHSGDNVHLDWIGFGIFLFCTVAYHIIYHVYAANHPLRTVKGKMEQYRKDWVESVLQTRNIIMAVQSIRNHLMATTWLAGSLLLFMAFFLTSGIRGEAQQVLDFLGASDRGVEIQIKIDLILATYGFSFLLFLLTLRHLVIFNSLLGTSAELITQVEGLEASEYLSQLLNRAHTRFSYGLRGLYFSLPAIAWLFSPWAFIFATVGIWLWVMLVLDMRNAITRPRRRLASP